MRKGNVNPKSVSPVRPAIAALLLGCSLSALAQSQPPAFRVETNLQSISVQVTDKQRNEVHGLTASDFTLLEAGQPQKIAFFEAESEPISLAILIDSSRSMDFGGKIDRARALLATLIRGNRPEDEIFLIPFSDEIGPFKQLSPEQRLRPPSIAAPGNRGSALYDALASTLCNIRAAKNIRRAVVVITDGVDLHSRLKLEQLLELVRSSSPQVFMIGLYDKAAYEIYQERHKTVTLTGLREIDNPMLVFERLAAESGAESFFPSSEQDFQKALDRISALLKAEYTLADYPQEAGKIRKIEVKVKGSGMRISARHSVGSASAVEAVHFTEAVCAVSPREHPLPWESRVTSTSSSRVYHEDFSDPRSGWPIHHDKATSAHYITGGYEVSRLLMPGPALDKAVEGVISDPADSVVAAYGPWWSNFRASAQVDALWGPPNAVGLVFDVSESGYYALLLTPPVDGRVAFELVKGRFDGTRSEIIPRTAIAELERFGKHALAVECNRGHITLSVDGLQVGSVQDTTFEYGMVGLGVFGECAAAHECRLIARDLVVEAIP
jgi:Ca-activated chloride channel family protein